jgi:hypothetical protein
MRRAGGWDAAGRLAFVVGHRQAGPEGLRVSNVGHAPGFSPPVMPGASRSVRPATPTRSRCWLHLDRTSATAIGPPHSPGSRLLPGLRASCDASASGMPSRSATSAASAFGLLDLCFRDQLRVVRRERRGCDYDASDEHGQCAMHMPHLAEGPNGPSHARRVRPAVIRTRAHSAWADSVACRLEATIQVHCPLRRTGASRS